MQRASRFLQTKIYTRKCFRIFFYEKGWKIFFSAAVIALIICSVTSDDMFLVYEDTRSGAFALVCACIWIGIFNSIQSVCKERDIIKREHRSGLHISSYIMSHMIFEMALCVVESLIVTLIFCAANWDNLPGEGVLLPTFLELTVTFFLIIYSSDTLGLMVSSIVKTPNTAMTVMPFVLILQLVMSGMIFQLEGFTRKVSYLTVSKWGLNLICITANALELERLSPAPIAESLKTDYEYTAGHLTELWVILILFTLIYGVIAMMSLKFVDRDKR